jgi:hypothetical protein
MNRASKPSSALALGLVPATKHARRGSREELQWAPSATSKTTARASRNAAATGQTHSGISLRSRETAAAQTIWSYANLNHARYVDPDGRQVPDVALGACQEWYPDSPTAAWHCVGELNRPLTLPRVNQIVGTSAEWHNYKLAFYEAAKWKPRPRAVNTPSGVACLAGINCSPRLDQLTAAQI